jgi:3-oxoacyl-ACP reductase-like protein
MSIFSSIMHKIFDRKAAPAPAAAKPTAAAPAAAAAAPPAPAASATPAAPVDVEAVLSGLAAQKGGGGNWRTSIVDLLKLLDLDSSLAARKELGQELGVHAGADGSAEQNMALQKAVMRKLAENGGKVPDSLKD